MEIVLGVEEAVTVGVHGLRCGEELYAGLLCPRASAISVEASVGEIKKMFVDVARASQNLGILLRLERFCEMSVSILEMRTSQAPTSG